MRLGGGLVNLWPSIYAAPRENITRDIHDKVDVVHGHQQLSLFNGHNDECFSFRSTSTTRSKSTTLALSPRACVRERH